MSYLEYKKQIEDSDESNFLYLYCKMEFIDRVYKISNNVKSYKTKKYKNNKKSKSERLIDKLKRKTGKNISRDNNEGVDKDNNIKKDIRKSIESSMFNFIDYIGLGLNEHSDEISAKIFLSTNKDDSFTNFLMNIFTTGMIQKAIFVQNPVGYHYVSIYMLEFIISMNNI